VGGQLSAARLLHVDGRTVRRWVAGDRTCHWMAAELLRLIALKAPKKALPIPEREIK